MLITMAYDFKFNELFLELLSNLNWVWAETPTTELQIKGPSVCGERLRVLVPAFMMTL